MEKIRKHDRLIGPCDRQVMSETSSIIGKKLTKRILPMLLLTLLTAGTVSAEAGRGFGIFIGASSFSLKDVETEASYSRHGWGGGVDYQLALGSSLSFNLFLTETTQSMNRPGDDQIRRVAWDSLGLELRYWRNAVFVGVNSSMTAMVLTDEKFSIIESGSAAGQGVVLGIESVGGWFCALHYRRIPKLELTDQLSINTVGTRFDLGHRWR